MNWLKSPFASSIQQRKGIFALILIIVCLQTFYMFSDSFFKTNAKDFHLTEYQKEIDSLKQIATTKSKPKIFPFNPNFITDYKGYTLGMSNEEIDKLHKFRAQDKWVNSSKQFQKVTGVSDSVLAKISPYFKFPEWVTNPKPNYKTSNYATSNVTYNLNSATAKQMQEVSGIGEKLSGHIVRLRDKLGGFASYIELNDVYGLKPEVIDRAKQKLKLNNPRQIQKININTAKKSQLVTIPHIDYEIAHNIIEARTLREGFTNFEELLKIEEFPTQKIEIIKLYLRLN